MKIRLFKFITLILVISTSCMIMSINVFASNISNPPQTCQGCIEKEYEAFNEIFDHDQIFASLLNDLPNAQVVDGVPNFTYVVSLPISLDDEPCECVPNDTAPYDYTPNDIDPRNNPCPGPSGHQYNTIPIYTHVILDNGMCESYHRNLYVCIYGDYNYKRPLSYAGTHTPGSALGCPF